jgi:hypothetical protein
MKEKSDRLKSILNAVTIALVVPYFILTSQTSSLAVQPRVAAGEEHTVGLKYDGTVVAVGGNENNRWLFAAMGSTIKTHQLEAFKQSKSTWIIKERVLG